MTAEERFERLESLLSKSHMAHSDRLASLAAIVQELAQAQLRMTEAAEKTEVRLDRLTQRMDQLAEAQQHTEVRLDRLTQRMDQLAEAQQHTEERMNALITVVDGVVRRPPIQ